MPLPMYSESGPSKKHSSIHHIVAIAAGKGGVGKSTITVNLALALKKLGYRVGILDADLYGPSLRRMLPEDRPPQQKGQLFVPALSYGVKTLSMAYFKPENQASAVRAPIANTIITQFLDQVLWGELDILLIDFPPGTGDIQLTLSQKANLSAAVLVTTPQEVSMMDVRKAHHLFESVRIPSLGIVENMSYFLDPMGNQVSIFGQGGGQKLSQELGIPLLAKIPLDPNLCEACDLGKPLFYNKDVANELCVQEFLDCAQKVKEHLDLLKANQEGMQHFELIWKA